MSERVVEITNEVLGLPLAQRVEFAQRLWDSIEDTSLPVEENDAAARREALRRSEELRSDARFGRSLDQAMEVMRRATEPT